MCESTHIGEAVCQTHRTRLGALRTFASHRSTLVESSSITRTPRLTRRFSTKVRCRRAYRRVTCFKVVTASSSFWNKQAPSARSFTVANEAHTSHLLHHCLVRSGCSRIKVPAGEGTLVGARFMAGLAASHGQRTQRTLCNQWIEGRPW